MAAANLSNRYITDRFLPDKAIDLMDEATSRLAMELESVPTRNRPGAAAAGATGAGRPATGRRDRGARPAAVGRNRRGNRRAAGKARDLREQWEAEKSGLGDVHEIRRQLAEVELAFNQLAPPIKEKQSSGIPVRRTRLPAALRAGHAAQAAQGRHWKRPMPDRRPRRRRPAACCGKRWARGNRRGRQRLDRHPRQRA